MANIPVHLGHGPLAAPLPFSEAEYARRLARLRAAMAEAGLDGYVAFAPETIFWLTGHDTPAYQYLQACLVTADETPLNLLRSIDASNTLAASWSRRAAIYDDDADPVRLLAALLGERLPPGSRIGIEDSAFFVTPRAYRALEALLPGQHLIGGDLVGALRLVKSAEEQAVIRAAGRITSAAMRAGIATARPGATENDVAAAVWAALVSEGGEFPGLPPFVVSGPRSSLGHATWAGRQIGPGDLLALEIPGVTRRYVAPLFRCGTAGAPTREMRRIEAACLTALDRMIAALRPGAVAADIHRLNAETFDAGGLRLGHRSGYSVGVNYAPDWGEGGLFSIRANEPRRIVEGMAFHLVPGIFVPGEFGLVISETVIVGPSGAVPVMDLPRELFRF